MLFVVLYRLEVDFSSNLYRSLPFPIHLVHRSPQKQLLRLPSVRY